MNKFILLVVFLGYSGICIGQVAEGLTPLQRKQLTVLSEPATLYKGFFRIGSELKYSRPGRKFDIDGNRRLPEDFNYAGRFLEQKFSFSYGLSDRIQFSVALPYVSNNLKALIKFNQAGNQVLPFQFDLKTAGFKDLQTELRFQLVKETTKIPSLIAAIGVWLPTGNNQRTADEDLDTGNFRYDDITGGIGTSVMTTIQVRKIVYPYLFAAEFSYFVETEGEIIENNRTLIVPETKTTFWRITTGMHLNEWITLTGELFYQFSSYNNEFESTTVVPLYDNSRLQLLSFKPTLTFQFGKFRAQQVISIPLAGKSSNAELEYIAGIQYIF